MRNLVLTDDTIVELYPLHVGEQDEGEHEVGRPETGMFVSLPAEGVHLLTALQARLPLAEVRKHFVARYGQPPDLEDFVRGLVDCGFVQQMNGQPLEEEAPESRPSARPRGWYLLAHLPADRVAWLRSWPMTVLYVLVWLAVPLLFLLHPALVPSASNGVLHTHTLLNLVTLEVLGWGLVFLHELAHCLAARAYGCPCFVTLGRRLCFLVAQTDLTAARTLPRMQRYGPYLAGMTWDLLLLLACTLWQLTPLRSPLVGVLAYLLLNGLIFQFAFFMRTDLYFVFTNGFRLGNLMQDTQHWLTNLVCRLLRRAAPYDLESIPRRELRIIRWYALFYVLGVAVALADFFLLGLPLLLHLSYQAILGMRAGPTQLSFWDGTGYLLVVLLDFGLLFFVTWREYRVRGKEQRPIGLGEDQGIEG